MEEINEHELLRHCNILNETHEKLKKEILERSFQNEKAIIELNRIEEEYKVILHKLKNIKEIL